MMNANRTQSVPSRACTFLVILACAILGFASRVEASPFMLNFVSSGSSGGGGGHAGGTGGGGSASPLGLNLGGVTGQLSSTSGPRTPTTILSSSSSLISNVPETTVESLTATVKSSVASLPASGSLSHLELGNGETLSVSGPVVDSLVSSVSGGTSPTSGGAANTLEPSQPNTVGVVSDVTSGGSGDLPGTTPVSLPGTTPVSQGTPNDTSQGDVNSQIDAGINGGSQGSLASTLPDEIVQTVFTDVVSGIISTPPGITNPSSGVGAAADDPVHAPEPATLVLFASGLTLAARRLRRRR
jgi:hypothetical protein